MTPTFKSGDVFGAKTGLYVITANSTIDSKGALVMGTGAAKDAATRFPWLPKQAGDAISSIGLPNNDYGFIVVRNQKKSQSVGLLQVKRHYSEKASLILLGYGLHVLEFWLPSKMSVAMNFPCIGAGGLKPEVVLPL